MNNDQLVRRQNYARLAARMDGVRKPGSGKRLSLIKAKLQMNERSSTPLAVAIMGLLLAVISYAMADQNLARLVYGSGLASAGLSLVDWFLRPSPPAGRR